MREQGWIEPLPPTPVIRVEVQLAAVMHACQAKALVRSARLPSTNRKEEILKRPLRSS